MGQGDILDLLLKYGEMSREEIREKMGTSTSSVGILVSKLVKYGEIVKIEIPYKERKTTSHCKYKISEKYHRKLVSV